MGDTGTVWKDRELLEFSRKLSEKQGAQLSHVLWRPEDAKDEYSDRLRSMFHKYTWSAFPDVLERFPQERRAGLRFDASSLSLEAGVQTRVALGRAAWLSTNPWGFTATQGVLVKYLLSLPEEEQVSYMDLRELLDITRSNVSFQLSTTGSRLDALHREIRPGRLESLSLTKRSLWGTRNPLLDEAREFLESPESNRDAYFISQDWPVEERALLIVLDRSLQEKEQVVKRISDVTEADFDAKRIYSVARSLDERLREAGLGEHVAIQDVAQRSYRALLSARGEQIRHDVRKLNNLRGLATTVSVPTWQPDSALADSLEEAVDDGYAGLRGDVERWLDHPSLDKASSAANMFRLLLDQMYEHADLPIDEGRLDLYALADRLGVREDSQDLVVDEQAAADVDSVEEAVVSSPSPNVDVLANGGYRLKNSFLPSLFDEEQAADSASKKEPSVQHLVPPRLDPSVYPSFSTPAPPADETLSEDDKAPDTPRENESRTRKRSKDFRRTSVTIDPFKNTSSFQPKRRMPTDPVRRVGADYVREDGTIVLDTKVLSRKRIMSAEHSLSHVLPPRGARFSDRLPVQDGKRSAGTNTEVAYREFFNKVADFADEVLSERNLLFPRWRGYYDSSVKKVLAGRSESGPAPAVRDIHEVLREYSTRAFGSQNAKRHLLFMKSLLERERLDALIEERGVFSAEGVERFLPDLSFSDRRQFYDSLVGQVGSSASSDDVMDFYLGLKHGSQNGEADLFSLTEAFMLNAGTLRLSDAHAGQSGFDGADRWAGKLLGIGAHPLWERERLYIARNNMDVDTIIAGTQRKAKTLARGLVDYLRFRGFRNATHRLKVPEIKVPEGFELEGTVQQPELYEVVRSPDDEVFGREGVVFAGHPFPGSYDRQRFTLPLVETAAFPLFHEAARAYVAIGLGSIVPDRD